MAGHAFSKRSPDERSDIRDQSRPVPPAFRYAHAGYLLPEYTTDLLDLLNVLGRLIALEPAQADLLNRICAGPLRSADELREAGAFADGQEKSASLKGKSKSKA